MIFAPGTCWRTFATIRRVGSMHQRANSSGGRTPAQVSKICTASTPASQLPHQIVRRGLDQDVDQRRERFRIAIGEQPRRRLVRRAVPGDHVGRDRPGRAAEAEKRHVCRQIAPSPRDRLVDRREHAFVDIHRSAVLVAARISSGSSCGPSPAANVTCLSERMRNHQNVREQDRGVEAEAPDRLQRHFGRQLGRKTEVEETAGLPRDRPILRKIAAGLPHHPDRRRASTLADSSTSSSGFVHRAIPLSPFLPKSKS